MKVGIIGAGNIGSALASLLIFSDFVSEISLIDIREEFVKGRALDLKTMAIVLGKDTIINGSNDYGDIKDFDIVVITAGVTRKAGQSRDDLLKINASIVGDISANISKFAPNSTIIMVTNPLDTLTFYTYIKSGFSANKIIGMAGELDSARAKINLAYKEQISPNRANAYVLGTHDEYMEVFPKDVSDETKNGGALITKLTGTSAYFAPAGAIYKMIKALKFGGEIICSVIDEQNGVAYGKKVVLKDMKVSEILKSCEVDIKSLKDKISTIE